MHKTQKKPRQKLLIILLLIGTIHFIFAQKTDDIPVTRWISPSDEKPMSFEEYSAGHPYSTITIHNYTKKHSENKFGKIVILINNSLSNSSILLSPLQQFYDDLDMFGWNVSIYEISGGTPENIKDILTDEWGENLKGAILIGQLPVPWFEMEEAFKQTNMPKEWVEFPCDLFYMDLDGDWTDNDNDGKYDSHTGDWQPDIYVGNLFAHNLAGNEAQRIMEYLDRNHKYRWGELEKVGLSLSYCDDDWTSWASQWSDNASAAFGEMTNISDINTTNSPDYKSRIPNQYDLIQTFVHSWPQGHSFKINNGSGWDYIYSSELALLEPGALFYNLFACSNSRYIESDYMGGCYLFDSPAGLGVLGSTKTGSMLHFGHYYSPLANGATFGEAFRQWFAIHGQEPGDIPNSMSWFYGMTYLGDPTLKLEMEVMYQNGDPNNDHTINVLDIIFTLQIILQQYEPDELEFGGADVNNDGFINVSDIILIIDLILNR